MIYLNAEGSSAGAGSRPRAPLRPRSR